MPLLTDEEIAGMRGEVVATSLDMTCVIQRNTGTTRDSHNQPIANWVTLHNGIACHYWEMTEIEEVGGTNATVSKERIVLAANTDATTRDRVLSVTGVDGSVVASGLAITEVLKRINDTVLVVKDVV